MRQLELQLSGFDLPAVIDHFENKETMYRWWPTEIVNRISKITSDQALIDHFLRNPNELWYRDEIIQALKMMIGRGEVRHAE